MSVTHDNLRAVDSGETRNWFLQVDDGDVYGPVSHEELIQWARQGRIEPDDHVSQDRKNWKPAYEIDDLEMVWEVVRPDETRVGPVCESLLPELIEKKVIAADMTATHRRSGQTLPVKEILQEMDATFHPELPLEPESREPDSPPPPPEGELPLDQPAAVQEEEPPAAPAEPAPREEPTVDQVTTRRLSALQESAAQAREQLAQVRRELTQQKAESSTLHDQLRKLEEDLRLAEQARTTSESERLGLEERATTAEAELENARAQFEQLQTHYERLQVESQEQFEALDAARAELMQAEQRNRQLTTECEERLRRKTGMLGQAIRCLLQDPDLEKGEIPSALECDAQLQSLTQSLTEQLEKTHSELKRTQEHAEVLDRRLADRKQTQTRRIVATFVFLILLSSVSVTAYRYGKAIGSLEPMARSKPRREAPAPQIDQTTPEPTTEIVAPAAEVIPAPEPEPPVPSPMDPEPASPKTVTEPIAWPELQLARATVHLYPRIMMITFSYGLFDASTELSEAAKADLASVANQIRPFLDRFNLIVEGHTDAIPVTSSDGRYVDNFALGMARANNVVKLLQARHKLPLQALFATSAGEADPPHPNDTAENRKKNRTVVLKLVPKG